MVKPELLEIRQLGKFTIFVNTEYGALITMVTGELDEVLYYLEWDTLRTYRIEKEVAGGGIINGDKWFKFSTGDLVKKTKVKIEVSSWLMVFFGKIG